MHTDRWLALSRGFSRDVEIASFMDKTYLVSDFSNFKQFNLGKSIFPKLKYNMYLSKYDANSLMHDRKYIK
jgi:hypothetical protein